MKKLLLPLLSLISQLALQAQVTQINSNNSLRLQYPISTTKAIFNSRVDQTVWVTDGTVAGTLQLSADIKFVAAIGSTSFLNGTLIFSGTTVDAGTELFITDGTVAGTSLIKDINTGILGSDPDGNSAILNGILYFTAVTAAAGRELWRTDGTTAGTSLVKDIVPGTDDSNDMYNYDLFSTGSYLLFAANTPANGIELWKSDGTETGTAMLIDINTGNAGADSSNPAYFYNINGNIIFTAQDATHGKEFWFTNGTSAGTQLLKDINPGPGSSTGYEFAPGFSQPIFNFFRTFNGNAYFNAFDGTSTGQLWKTDGTSANTALLKEIIPGISFTPSLILLLSGVNLAGKFIFPVSNLSTRYELWESDGTPDNTKLFKSFDEREVPFIFPPIDFSSASQNQQPVLFQGNKFFFAAKTAAEGRELWVSDGTVANTQMVTAINPGVPDGIPATNFSYTYTPTALYFPGDNGANGIELWKSDGTPGGTTMVDDIVIGAGGSATRMSYFIINNKVIFEANNGDNFTTDLYAVDGIVTPLPIKLLDFTVMPKLADAMLNWRTSQEVNSKDYTIQRSFDGYHFKNIGTVPAAGTSATGKAYSFTDIGVVNGVNSIVYYRLIAADIDGKSTMSPVITLKMKGNGKWEVKLQRNPVLEDIKVILSGITGNVQISIVDMNGKKLYTNRFPAVNGQISLPAGMLPHGMYTLITETLNERKTIQFVK